MNKSVPIDDCMVVAVTPIGPVGPIGPDGPVGPVGPAPTLWVASPPMGEAEPSVNIAIGPDVFAALTTGSSNIAIGAHTLKNLSIGNFNIAIGDEALFAATSFGPTFWEGSGQNIAIGGGAMREATKAQNNVAIGSAAMYYHETGAHNTCVGSLGMILNVGDVWNTTAIGYSSLWSQDGKPDRSGASANTAVGANSLLNVVHSHSNTAIGFNVGPTLVDGWFNVLVGRDADVSAATSIHQIAIGYHVKCAGDYICTIGAGDNTASLSLDGSDTSWAAASDARLKTDVEDYSVGLSFIEALQPITYRWKAKREVPPELPGYQEGSDEPCRGFGKRYVGFVAQDVKAVMDSHLDIPDGQHLWAEWGGVQAIAQAELIPILVNAVKELAAQVARLEGR